MKYLHSLLLTAIILLLGSQVSAKTNNVDVDLDKITKKIQKRYDSIKTVAESKSKRLAALQAIIMLERDLRILTSPKKTETTLNQPEEITTSSSKKITKLQQDLRTLEIARIKNALDSSTALYNTKEDEKINKIEYSLDKINQQASKKMLSSIEKLNKKLNKKNSSSTNIDKAEIKDEIADIETKLTKLSKYIYPDHYFGGFEKTATEDNKTPDTQLLNDIITTRDILLEKLRAGKTVDPKEKEGAIIDGIYIYSANLGVILDTSGSMTPHLESLRKDIDDNFSGTRYKECVGCSISNRTLSDLSRKLSSESKDTVSFMFELIVVHKVDTIYWFCDLNDPIEESALRWIRILLKQGNTQFSVRSVNKKPTRELELLISNFTNK